MKKDAVHRGGGNDQGATRRAGASAAAQNQKGIVLDGKLLVQKEQPIRFSPCSPGQIIEMCQYLGVDPDQEFYLLPVVRRAVVAPFPQDWAVGVYCAWRGAGLAARSSRVRRAPLHAAPCVPGLTRIAQRRGGPAGQLVLL